MERFSFVPFFLLSRSSTENDKHDELWRIRENNLLISRTGSSGVIRDGFSNNLVCCSLERNFVRCGKREMSIFIAMRSIHSPIDYTGDFISLCRRRFFFTYGSIDWKYIFLLGSFPFRRSFVLVKGYFGF